MVPLILNLDCADELYRNVAQHLHAQPGELELRSFPDGESYVRVVSGCVDREVIVLCGLDQPNPKLLPLLLVINTLRDLGAKQVGLIAPYLAYMRQDIRFKEGEGITSRYFAALLSQHVDWLVTVDPHLHRIKDLSEIYSIPAKVARAAPVLAEWIVEHVSDPVLIGPDSESEQWVAEVAAKADAPFLILEKVRTGDRHVEVSIPNVERHSGRVPVLVDDIVSTGRTFIETIRHLKLLGLPDPICMAVHGVFAKGALEDLLDAGAAEVVTCNTIAHRSNALDVSRILSEAAVVLMEDRAQSTKTG